MEGKVKNACDMLCGAVLLAGLIILLMGGYYEVVKAGIPYQDPPLELQIQYAINAGIGDELCKIGFYTILCGIVFRLTVGIIRKMRRGNPQG